MEPAKPKSLSVKEIGSKLRDYRKKKGLTLAQVGQIIGRAQSSISDWETGKSNVDPDTFMTLCELYEVESIGVFYGEPAPINDLSFDERSLIEFWRTLDKEERCAFIKVLKAFQK